MNFDGASKGNPGASGFGAVVRDEEGNLVAAVCGQAGFVSNNIVEITALEEGLKWTTSNDIKKVVIEGDSKVILSRIIKHCFTNWHLNAWIPRIYGHLQKFMNYQIQHTLREGNQVADLLANHGIVGTLPAVLSPANVGNKDIQQRLLEDRARIPRTRIEEEGSGKGSEDSRRSRPLYSKEKVKQNVVSCLSNMVHRFGLSCLCREETLEAQCERLFDIDIEGQRAIKGVLDDAFNEERHRCDGYVYEIILCLLVDVLSSKEACVEKLEGFVRKEDVEAMGEAMLEVEEEWASILGPYFNPTTILSNAECSNPKDEIRLAVEALRMRKVEFMAEAWEVFQVGVKNANLGPFRRMMMKEDGWLSEGSIDKVVTIGMRVATILRLM
ncbi:hypothetical protein SUGI_1035360 [Cryptomeria japonica]|nr:hypothetical protein SUGI_1035360 [Cryptomeria japonica]